ncbi:MAG: glycosyltransferase family 4 protein [Flavobacteriales bacterium]|nr:glycosyltransferase family 4 protein [Flavobacteriales bacterium]
MKILYIHRSKKFGGQSFEMLFSSIRMSLIDCETEIFYDKTYPTFLQNILAIRKIKCDVIHITGGVGYYAFFLPTRKTILTFHDTNHYEFDLKGIKKWLYGLLIYKLPSMSVRCVTTVSEHTKKNLIRFFGMSNSKIKVISNCYPPSFKFSPKESLSDTPRILHIGTKPNKNILSLIKAIKGLPVELTIIGKLNSQIEMLLVTNSVKYINKYNLTSEEIYNEYLNCDFVSFISLHEGFGLPIIEANAIGRPIITSNISSMPEIAGDSAILVNPTDVEEINKSICNLINNKSLRKLLVENGRMNAQNYTPKKISGLYKKVYSELLNN